MESFNIESILSQYADPDFSEEITYDDYRYWLESTVEINKPDFVLLLNLKMKNPVLYSKNYNLKINESDDVSIFNIVRSVDPAQIQRILEADQHCIQFIETNKDAMNNTVLQLRFNSYLDTGKPRSFLRNVSFIPRNRQNNSFFLILVTLTDITEFLGFQKEPSAGVRYLSTKFGDLDNRLDQLRNDLNEILNPTVKLTKREKQILNLISLGQTSDIIAKDLSISVNTVNTHRQNLIRKFKVRNTAALLNLI